MLTAQETVVAGEDNDRVIEVSGISQVCDKSLNALIDGLQGFQSPSLMIVKQRNSGARQWRFARFGNVERRCAKGGQRVVESQVSRDRRVRCMRSEWGNVSKERRLLGYRLINK